jgi:DNA processing protein
VRTEPDADVLRLAMAVVRYGRGPRRVAGQVRQQGPQAVRDLYDGLTVEQRYDVDDAAQALEATGVVAVLLGLGSYPTLLASLRRAPPVLFLQGNIDLLGMPSIGVCGSRDASSQGLNAAHACGEEIARCGLVVVSGYARGVDTEAHTAALDIGGRTVMVLAEGIARFKAKRWLATRSHDPLQVAAVSQFPPNQTWSVAGAMNRNAVIIGLSLGLVVIEARDTGGTLAAGLQALDERRPVLVLEFSQDMPQGNKILIRHGAIPVRGREQLRERLRQLLAGNLPGQPTLV